MRQTLFDRHSNHPAKTANHSTGANSCKSLRNGSLLGGFSDKKSGVFAWVNSSSASQGSIACRCRAAATWPREYPKEPLSLGLLEGIVPTS